MRCDYPTPFWNDTANKCVSRCQGEENYVDINLICLNTCTRHTSNNYEIYAGYEYTTCGRKCTSSDYDDKQCKVCPDTILNNVCVENCSKGNESYILDVN